MMALEASNDGRPMFNPQLKVFFFVHWVKKEVVDDKEMDERGYLP